MPLVKGRDIGLMLRDKTKGPSFVTEHLEKALENKQIAPDDFSIKDLFVNVVPDGREMVESFSSRKSGGFSSESVLEAADAVSTSHFANITGQFLYSKIMEQAQGEDYIFSRLVPNVPTQFSGERIPGIANLADEAQVVAEGDSYPVAGFNEDWLDTPQTVKRGNIVPITKEAIFFDRTNLVLRTAGKVGLMLGANKEKRIINAFLDDLATTATTAHRYKWRGTAYATYVASGGHGAVNKIASGGGLIDWTDIDAVEQLAADVVDPNTGEPMPLMLKHLICTPQLAATAARILNATNVQTAGAGYATSGTVYATDSPTPLGRHQYSPGGYQVVTSRLLKQLQGTDTTWFMGNLPEALCYMENWPITVEQAAGDSAKSFERDIVAQFKASERGAAYVMEPRYLFASLV